MSWQEIMSQGGIWALLAFILIDKVIVPLTKRVTSDTGSKSKDCDAAHAIIAERLASEKEARKSEAEALRAVLEKLDKTIDRMAAAVEDACSEFRAQKKG